MSNKVKIGTALNNTQEVFLNVISPQTNGHTLLLGESGSGKTYFSQVLVEELVRQGCKIFILDLAGSLSNTQGDKVFFQNMSDKIMTFNVSRDGVPINIFQRIRLDKETVEKDCDLVGRLIDSLSCCVGTGEIQRGCLYKYMMEMLRHCRQEECRPSLHLLREMLSWDRSNPARKLVSRLNLLIDGDYFSSEAREDMGEQHIVKLLQMQSVPSGIKRVVADIVLWQLWSWAVQSGNRYEPVFVLIDEFQNLNFSPSSPLYKILCEGRKYGLNLILATQFFQGKFSYNVEMAIDQMGNKIFFKPSDREIKYVASLLVNDIEGKKKWEQILRMLRRGEAVIKGNVFLGSNIDRQLARPLKVKIKQLNTRGVNEPIEIEQCAV